jgi:Ca-activated chloride channel family protein
MDGRREKAIVVNNKEISLMWPARTFTFSISFALRLGMAFVLLLLLLGGEARAQDQIATGDLNKTGAAYFLVTSDVKEPDQLPLKESQADINIAGVIAHVRVTQTYQNTGALPLEAIYVFPGSTRSAVFGMKMTVGDRIIKANINKKEQARKIYEAAKEEGKTASLLEQHRPNVFQMNVANILPGETVKVELDYTELVVPTDGTYEIVYPAVVGPRYAGEQTSGETWHKNTYISGAGGKAEPFRFRANARIDAGMPIQKIASSSHTISPSFQGKSMASVSVTEGNRDFVLRYQLRGAEIQTGLLRFEGDDENFFLLMMQPPKTVARDAMPPREYVFIVDVSGSMTGFPLDVSKKLVSDLLKGLRPEDSFNILFFEAGSYQLSPKSLHATPQNISRAMRVLTERQGGGGTNMLAALNKALGMASNRDASRTFIAVTDGFVTVEDEAFQTVRKNLGKANFFAFGIGSSVNRHLIEGLARAGMGEPFIVLNQKHAPAEARRFRKLIESPALTNIKVSFPGFSAYDVEPLAVPDLMAERPLIIFGKYQGGTKGSIQVRGTTGKGSFEKDIPIAGAMPTSSNRALRYLWARHRIAGLSDRLVHSGNQELETEITNLGLKYSLLTEYTSFVAVDNAGQRNTSNTLVTVRQPLPQPQGVSISGTISSRSYDADDSEDSEDSDYGGSDDYYEEDGYRRVAITSSDIHSSTSGTGITRKIDLGHRIQVGKIGDTNIVTLPILARIPITRRFEGRVESRLLSLADSEFGTPDLGVGVKAKLFGQGPIGVGALADIRLSLDDDDPNRLIHRALLLTTARLGQIFLRMNLGMALNNLRNEAGTNIGFAYGGELSFRLPSTPVKIYAGANGVTGDSSAASVQQGLSLRLSRKTEIGITSEVGLTDTAPDFLAGIFARFSL